MNRRLIVSKWLSATPLTGLPMLLCVLAGLIAPTLIGVWAASSVKEIGFAPYLPFVVLAALLLNWQISAVFTAASASLGDFFFVGPRYELLETSGDIFGILAFAAAAALAIAMAHAFRRALADPTWFNGSNGASKGIVFSEQGGQVYASWYAGRSFVPIGPEAEVAKMMQDFLAQREVGKRLANRSLSNTSVVVTPSDT